MTMSVNTVAPSTERHYTTLPTFLRACRHYRERGRRILAYIKHAQGWTLVLEVVR